jgi:glycosyltransferase involved in cell wall biosynthesis
MFRVALVVIARNEERRIGRLLDSLRSKLEAMVVLDTGSDDATVDQARMHGARVAHQAWTDDFTAARNAALDLAAADWHLVLDADEWLIDGGEFLEQLRRTPPDFVGQILLEDDCATEGTTAGTTRNWLSRLLPGHVRYEGRIHEQPVHQLPVRRTPLRVGHDGYSPEALAAKRGRNRRLLERALAEQPGDVYLKYQLAKDASVYAEHDLADRWFRAAWHGMEHNAPWRTDLVVRWIFTLKKLRRHDEAAELARLEERACSNSPDFHFAVGDLMLDWTSMAPESVTQLLNNAERAWRRCLGIGERPDLAGTVQGRGSHLAAFNLALILEGTGRSIEAAALRKAYGLSPSNLLD